jgi:AraC-like DNA-binding protein
MMVLAAMIIRDTCGGRPGCADLQSLPLERESCLLLMRGLRAAPAPMTWPVPTLHACWSGSVTLAFDDRSVRIDAGDYFCALAGRSLRLEAASAAPVRMLTLAFRAGLAAEVGGVREPPIISEHIVTQDRATSCAIDYVVRTVERGFRDEQWLEEQYRFVLERVIGRQHSRLSRFASSDAPRRGSRLETLRRIDRARDFMLSNFERPLSLSDIAQQAFLSPFHFARLFRQIEGMTTYEFLQRRRARCALTLLNSSRLPLEEVARLSGFNSRVTLFRACKQFFARSPSELRAA